MVSAAFINGLPAYASERSDFSTSTPQGFEALASDREVMLDAYFGGRKIGEVRATIRPGSVTFHDPSAVATLVPDVARLAELVAGLSGPLPANVNLVCGSNRHEGCGTLQPERAGVIVDDERFRVEIFVSSDLLVKPDPTAASYLSGPVDQPSLISLFGATVSGSSRGDRSWHVQNRSIASLGEFRLRNDSSLATGTGLTIDNLSVETDRQDWRYAGGIFWVPGTDLIGRRRIIGLGMATQLDTRQDKTALMSTPLAVFLQQPARVEILVDGRIVSSRILPAGNRLVDTTSLPNGSYEIVLRIQEDGRPIRQEQRFFSKGSPMAPIGRPLFSAFAGILPSSNRGVSLEGRTFFYEATAAYRLTPALGVDAAILGTPDKAIVEGGAILHTRRAQIRVAALISTSADYGAVVRASSVGQGPLSLSLDLRTIKSRDGRPLLPVTTSRGTFSEDPEVKFGDRGSYTQAQSIIGYRLGPSTLRLTGLYRSSPTEKSSYSIGASVEFPVVRSSQWDFVIQADTRKTDRDFASFVGGRIRLNRGSLAITGSAGVNYQSDRPDSAGGSARLVGEGQAAWYQQLSDHTQLSADAAIGRDIDATYARASAYARSPMLNARADVLRHFGSDGTTQYSATVDGGIAMTKDGVSIAGRELNDTAAMVSVGGGEHGQEFDVLVDEVVRGTVTNDGRLLLFMQPYQAYEIRLRPRNAQIASFDTAPRKVTLYPGNVAGLKWEVTPLFILFGRAVGTDGKPVAHADVSGSYGIGRTDGDGYFQIETNRTDRLRFDSSTRPGCATAVPEGRAVNGLVSAGDLVCR